MDEDKQHEKDTNNSHIWTNIEVGITLPFKLAAFELNDATYYLFWFLQTRTALFLTELIAQERVLPSIGEVECKCVFFENEVLVRQGVIADRQLYSIYASHCSLSIYLYFTFYICSFLIELIACSFAPIKCNPQLN